MSSKGVRLILALTQELFFFSLKMFFNTRLHFLWFSTLLLRIPEAAMQNVYFAYSGKIDEKVFFVLEPSFFGSLLQHLLLTISTSPRWPWRSNHRLLKDINSDERPGEKTFCDKKTKKAKNRKSTRKLTKYCKRYMKTPPLLLLFRSYNP